MRLPEPKSHASSEFDFVTVSQNCLALDRATIVGTLLTCEFPLLGGTLTHDTGLTTGGPTLITQYTDASYDDLKVCALP